MRVLYFICIISVIILTSSCSSTQNQLLFQNRATIDTLSQKNQANTGGYLIKPQDVLQIRNLQNIKYIVDEVPTSSAGSAGSGSAGSGQTYQVEEDGTVALPVIGHVKVTGLTRTGASKFIEDLYRKNLLKDPIIEVKILNLKVTLLGEVTSQGNYILTKDNTTLVELLGQAGGLTANSNEKNIKIIRGEQTKTVMLIDLSDINSISDPKAVLQNGDIIYIAKNKRAVRVEKLQDFSTLVQPGLLLLNTALLIFSITRL
jgi:polysaccharide export outer membrane protein